MCLMPGKVKFSGLNWNWIRLSASELTLHKATGSRWDKTTQIFFEQSSCPEISKLWAKK